MTKSITLLAFCFLLVISCQKNDVKNEVNQDFETTTSLSEQRCASHELLEEKLAADPALRERMRQIEDYTQAVLKNKDQFKLLTDGTIEIPVYFHVLYKASSENISDAQLQSQIDVLNEDFTMTNADATKVPSHFKASQTDVQIRFTWDKNHHVRRKYVNKTQWQVNDDMKFDSKGGSNVYQPQNYLNIWVVNKMRYMGQTILGYAQFPGGNWATDGIVLGHNFTGRTGKVSSPYHLGRTATHEVGHWINLRHIWGDATCGNDFVADTPQHNTSNGGCPSADHRSTCSGTPLEMWMNYMDYTYDQCMYMFTHGQKDRMRAVFTSGAFREVLGMN
jgi:hypothetical protein